MQFCIIRDAPAGATGKDAKRARGVMLSTRRLAIGSAANQHLQLPADDAEPKHAILSVSAIGRMRLEAVGQKGFSVNGRRETRKASLRTGDVVRFGASSVTVEKAQSPRMVMVRVQVPPPAEEDGDHGGGHGDVPQISMSSWSWNLVFAVTVLCLLLPLGGVLVPPVGKLLRDSRILPTDALWSPGPLHSAHQSITDCGACHKSLFTPVRDQECGVCHADVQHHVDVRSADVGFFTHRECASCHYEHKQPATLVMNDTRLCTDCHADIRKLKPESKVANAWDFGTGHPEFRITVLTTNPPATASPDTLAASAFASTNPRVGVLPVNRAINDFTPNNSPLGKWRAVRLDRSHPESFVEHSHLHFSHAQHLNPKGIKSPTGDRVLSCQDCHRPNSSGRLMLPVRMESQCSGCHSLRFDERDPTSDIPHGDLQSMYKNLREHFSREYLEQGGSSRVASDLRRPGQDVLVATRDDQLRARDWVDTQAMKIARELLEHRLCVDCHEVTKLAGGEGLDHWRVEPVRLTQTWMPFAQFSHAAHISQQCTDCHTQAPNSKQATDILMPSITQCRQCHGGANDTTKVASDCLMCHQFHLPNRGRLIPSAVTASRGSQ